MDWLPKQEEILIWVLLTLFFVTAFFQLFWVVYFYARLIFHRDRFNQNLPPVSVIIAARNEENNLFNNLPFILTQEYSNDFEVIVVNHQSADDSKHILKALAREHKNLKIVNLERNRHLKNGKKLPLTIGIKGAKYEHLIFTDADCKPNSKFWLQKMAGRFNAKKNMVIGYGPYTKKSGFLNLIIRLDTVFIAINYLSFALGRAPYMGVGRNMGYTKTLFHKTSGFKSHYSIQSGDDDLFVQEAAKKNNYTVCLDEDTFVYSEPKETFADWIKQKGRHFTTTDHYKVFKKLLLGIYPLTLLFMYLIFFILLFYGWVYWSSLIVLFGIIIIKWVILGFALHRLREKSFIYLFPFWDLFYAILAPIIFYTTDKTKVKWK